ncbi:MAG: hypothetical protein IKH68_05010 [Erysipelotrichaceae bacterium]|nr:hypothetical protein [Erysipelotrichaceae bacterium]
MNYKIYLMNLAVPAIAVLAIAIISGIFKVKKKESIKGEVFDYFVSIWKSEENKEEKKEGSFYQKFFDMLLQTYEYEKYKESSNRLKYYFYKLLVLLVILSIPFLALFLITSKEWLLNDSEWNNIYLYAAILVPLIFAYLINQYIRIKQFRETWYRHLRNRHQIEWRMLTYVKDHELLKEGKTAKEAGTTFESLKIDFINSMCDCWKSAATEIDISKEENIFEGIGSLFKS